MSNDEGMTKLEETFRHSIVRACFVIRHSYFVVSEALASPHLPVFDEFVGNFFQET